MQRKTEFGRSVFFYPDLVESGWIRNTVQCPQCCMLHLQKSGGDLRGFLFHSRIKPKSEDLRSRLDKHKVRLSSIVANKYFFCLLQIQIQTYP